jgi:acyl-coenzyme A thioesterase PaaI-like protein
VYDISQFSTGEAVMEIPKINLEKMDSNDMCFGCGKKNEHGFQLKFRHEGRTATAEFTPMEFHQGWPGFVHGGAMMAVLDEAIGWATHFEDLFTVTAKIEIRIKSMARVGEKLIVSATIVKETTRTTEMEATLKRLDGSIVAEATSLQFITGRGGHKQG